MKALQVLTKWLTQLITNDNNLYINYDRFISNILINKNKQMNTDFIKDLCNEYFNILEKLNYNLSEEFRNEQILSITYLCSQIEDKLTKEEYLEMICYSIAVGYDNNTAPIIEKKFFFGKMKQKRLVKFINLITQSK